MAKVRWPDRLLPIMILMFLLWALLEIGGRTEYLFDRVMAAVQIGLLWWTWRRFRVSTRTLLIAVLAISLHHLKLYGNVYLGLGFDNYMHFAASFALALLLVEVFPRMPVKSLFVFFAAIGAAASIEPLEYLGYAVIGSGEGILGYGAGDGGWSDTAFDLMANMLGAAAALVFCSISQRSAARPRRGA